MTRMHFEQEESFTDMVRPDGEPMRVRFRGEASRRPEVAAGLAQLLQQPLDGNIYEAVSSYASGLGLGATYYLGTEWVIIEIYEPPNLKPLVNASGGSPRSSINRESGVAVSRPAARSRRSRAPTRE